MSIITFSPVLGPVLFDAVLSEDHESDVEITSNPIETGSEVNDHAYIKPKKVTLEVADNNAAIAYNALVAFQETRVPFYMVTGLRIYRNMLISSVRAQRDKDTSKILRATVTLREVIIVNTGAATATSSENTTEPGGAKSRKSVTPSAETATDDVTADRAAGKVSRGDTPSVTVPEQKQQSLLKGLFS